MTISENSDHVQKVLSQIRDWGQTSAKLRLKLYDNVPWMDEHSEDLDIETISIVSEALNG